MNCLLLYIAVNRRDFFHYLRSENSEQPLRISDFLRVSQLLLGATFIFNTTSLAINTIVIHNFPTVPLFLTTVLMLLCAFLASLLSLGGPNTAGIKTDKIN